MSEDKRKVVKEMGKARIVVMDTSSEVKQDNNMDIIITGSHGGVNACEYMANLKIKGMVSNDAGIGKNEAGIAGMKGLDKWDIPAVAVSSMSAKIGNGTSTYEQGKVSAINELAKKLGIKNGMSAIEAADIMLEDLAKRSA